LATLAHDPAATRQALKDRWLEGKESQHFSRRPNFFIVYGPPASGKATILEHTISHMKRSSGVEISPPVEIVVDDLVQAWPGYEKEVAKCRTEAERQKLYWGLRKAEPFKIDDLNDEILEEATNSNMNVQFETTGMTIGWTKIVMESLINKGYNIVVVYPFVLGDSLVERSVQRQQTTGQTAAPAEEIINRAVAASENIFGLLAHADQVYLWDNNGAYGHPSLVVLYNKLDHNFCRCHYVKEWLRKMSTLTSQSPSAMAIVDKLVKFVRKAFAEAYQIGGTHSNTKCSKKLK
jgi:predicted ABC-type ATPase